MNEIILVTGAAGQLGVELTRALVERHGMESVIASDVNAHAKEQFGYCHFMAIDVLDMDALCHIVKKYKVTQIYHLAAVLSANGERNPLLTWNVNVQGLLNVLEAARTGTVKKVFWPSSIAVFGDKSPKVMVPQHCIMNPNTVYGKSKLAGELWCDYYFRAYGLDVRSVRYPGLIGYNSPPGGGTTDYAVDIFHKALAQETFTCYLKPDTFLPMMYMPDAIKATLEIMDAHKIDIKVRTSYNISGMSFSPIWLYKSILKYHPGLKIRFEPDFRLAIAESWPVSLDDTQAQRDWGWKSDHDLDSMVEDMFRNMAMPKTQNLAKTPY